MIKQNAILSKYKISICSVVFVLMPFTSLLAATFNTVNNGAWGDPATWDCNCVPGNINNGDVVNISHEIIAEGVKVNNQGTINILENGALIGDQLDINGPESKVVVEGGGYMYFDSVSGNTDNITVENSEDCPEEYSSGCSDPNDTNCQYGSCETLEKLPITLLNFTTETYPQKILLQWSTASEKDFDYFSIERSRNAKTYTEIGVVKGVGFNTVDVQSYSFVDDEPLNGRSYYRLRAVDLDGTYEFFNTVSVNFNNGKQAMDVYPNPMKGAEFSLSLDFVPSPGATLKVTDIAGAEIFSTEVNESNSYLLRNHLPPGIYIVLLNDHGRVDKSRIIVN